MSDMKKTLEQEGLPQGSWTRVDPHTATPIGAERQQAALQKLRQMLEARLQATNALADELRLRLTKMGKGGGR